jgi:S-adenosylmethionine:tRNA ribosyltransferase-isomerase
MVVDRSRRRISHTRFDALGKYLPAGTVIVLNNSRVIPARLLGTKDRTGGKVEIFLLHKLPDGYSYSALLRPMRRMRAGDIITFAGSRVRAEILDVPGKLVRFSRKDIRGLLARCGHMPLPPYIKRPDTDGDRRSYQTVYARHDGSVAAPTAGLHFTRPMLAALKAEGHEIAAVTLHINYATFKPVEENDVTRHRMHEESYAVSVPAMKKIARAREEGRPVLAVGTTSCRVLETVASGAPLRGVTDLFLYPGYRFRTVDMLLTNFHLPQSSLLILVHAFGGTALMKKAYREAIREGYRFFSYGDAMLIV